MNGDEKTGEVVILFPWEDVGDDAAPFQSGKRSSCRHLLIRLDQDSHKTFCRDCNLEVDPFAFLLRLCHEWERWASFRKEAERRGAAASERLEETLRLERNARARVKRLDPTAALPEVPWGDGKGASGSRWS